MKLIYNLTQYSWFNILRSFCSFLIWLMLVAVSYTDLVHLIAPSFYKNIFNCMQEK